jgi:hypothetical protein
VNRVPTGTHHFLPNSKQNKPAKNGKQTDHKVHPIHVGKVLKQKFPRSHLDETDRSGDKKQKSGDIEIQGAIKQADFSGVQGTCLVNIFKNLKHEGFVRMIGAQRQGFCRKAPGNACKPQGESREDNERQDKSGGFCIQGDEGQSDNLNRKETNSKKVRKMRRKLTAVEEP